MADGHGVIDRRAPTGLACQLSEDRVTSQRFGLDRVWSGFAKQSPVRRLQ